MPAKRTPPPECDDLQQDAGSRPLRADARRNRARILEVASEVFASEGLAVPIDEIARRAGVGAGTVYRHFPTKESLFEAIVLDRVERLIDEARSLAAADDPGAAFFRFFSSAVEAGLANRGLGDALAAAGFDREAVVDRTLLGAIGKLLRRAQRAGAVRGDVDAADVKALMLGCLAMERCQGEGNAPRRLLAIVCDGLRGPRGS
ncbi:TetR/AcrR family transcriptional regulator [Sorangium sp. So ce1078]|uniref:TetR/AcrR family transcriptional regulator n=1 Tax=Sorangium sp. So ce1078 TaxID=3133329 RepID=UPI003F62F68D